MVIAHMWDELSEWKDSRAVPTKQHSWWFPLKRVYEIIIQTKKIKVKFKMKSNKQKLRYKNNYDQELQNVWKWKRNIQCTYNHKSEDIESIPY